MPALKTYDIFISHAWSHNDDYYRLIDLLNAAPNFKWRNYSVPEHDPADANSATKLREALKRQMRPVNVVLILSGMYAVHSDWIEFEVEFAESMDKPMVGIRPRGQERIPKYVVGAVEEMVGWNTSSIVSAIRRHAL